jgi:hypothetical protein
MCVLGYVCTEHPDTKLSIIFLPIFTFPAAAVSLQRNNLKERRNSLKLCKGHGNQTMVACYSEVYHYTKYYKGHTLILKVHTATILKGMVVRLHLVLQCSYKVSSIFTDKNVIRAGQTCRLMID